MQKKKQTKPIKQIILLIIAVILILLIIFAENIIKQQNKNKLNLAEISESNSISAEPEIPQLSAGMIPIKFDGGYWQITTSESDDWYDYSKGKPAYIMLNDGMYQSNLIKDMTDKKLASETIEDGEGAQIREKELGTIYVWIPRFAYKENGELAYVKKGTQPGEGWIVPEIFSYTIESESYPDFSLSGIWIEKDDDKACASKITEMSKENNKYGFIANINPIQMTNVEQTDITKYINWLKDTFIKEGSEKYLQLSELESINRIILRIINTEDIEPIKANILQNIQDKKVEIRVTYTLNGIYKIKDEYGNELALFEENGIVLANSGDIAYTKGTHYFTVIDNKGNKKGLRISINSLFTVAYINGTDNMSTESAYTKTSETVTSDENMLINQLKKADNSKTYSRAIIDRNKAITAIAQKERTSEDIQVNIYNQYVLNKAKKWTEQPNTYYTTSAWNATPYGYSNLKTDDNTGKVTLSGRTSYGKYYVELKYNSSKSSGNGVYYTRDAGGGNDGITYYWYYTKYMWAATDSPGDLISEGIIAYGGVYPDDGQRNSYWYKKVKSIPKYTICKYDKNLMLQSVYDVDTKILTTAPISLFQNKGEKKLKLILNATGTNYKVYISADATNWQEVTDVTSDTPKELNVDGWDKLYVKIETSSSTIKSLDIAYYEE